MNDYNCLPTGLLDAITLPPITWRDRLLWWVEDWTPFLFRAFWLSVLAYLFLRHA